MPVYAEPEGQETAVPEDIAAFPESYHSALSALKAQHPNWIFQPMNTGLDWNTVIQKEMQDGKSLVHKSLPNCTKEGAYDQGNWFYASKDVLSYYMDPRNGLTEDRIFQFEQLTYNASYHTQEALEKFLEGTFMNSNVNVPETVMKYAYVIYMIGKEEGREISPFHLAARILQEQGQGKSPLISGTYPGYEGYYNYFNIGATGNTNEEIIVNGLKYAKSNWQAGAYYAILGGADYIAGKYIKKGQYTLYLEKYNVNPQASYSLYSHQYMQNISAPTTEAGSIKKLYASANALESPFVFQIPVYQNMPEQAVPMPVSSTNVVLTIPTNMTNTKVTVDGVEYEGTNYYDYASHIRRLVVTLPDGNGKKAAIEFKDASGNVTSGFYWDLSYQGTYYTAVEGVKEEPEKPEEPVELTNEIVLELPQGISATEVWLDGIAYVGTVEDGKLKVTAADAEAKTAVIYVYDASGVPVDMHVWTLAYGEKGYESTLQSELQGLLSYHGFSIRITGKSGIRFKTGMAQTTKEALLGEGINGYHLKEYGTLVMNNANRSTLPMIKGGSKVVNGMAYGKTQDGSLLDNVFETVNGRLRFTGVLIGLPAEQYKTEFAFRGYAVLEKDGQDIIIYGPALARSIYALAQRFLDMHYYEEGSDADLFLKNLVRAADGEELIGEGTEGGQSGEGTEGGQGGQGTESGQGGEGTEGGQGGQGTESGQGGEGTGEGQGGQGTESGQGGEGTEGGQGGQGNESGQGGEGTGEGQGGQGTESGQGGQGN